MDIGYYRNTASQMLLMRFLLRVEYLYIYKFGGPNPIIIGSGANDLGYRCRPSHSSAARKDEGLMDDDWSENGRENLIFGALLSQV